MDEIDVDRRPGKISGTLRFRLLILILISVLPAFGLLIYGGLQLHTQAENEVKNSSVHLADQLARDHESLVEQAHVLLPAFARLPSVLEKDADNCELLFEDLLNVDQDFVFFGATDVQGNIFCSAPASDGVSVYDRPYFQALLQTQDFTIGEYQIGRISGKPEIVFAYPVFNESNALQGAVLASIDLERFRRVAEEINLPERTTLILIDQNGTILARVPQNEAWVGRQFSEISASTNFGSLESTLSIEGTGLDGEERFFGIADLHASSSSGELYMLVGLSRQVAFRSANQLIYTSLIGLFVVTVTGFIIAWIGSEALFLRKVRTILQTIEDLSGGNLKARTSMPSTSDELDQIGSAFDHMAGEIESRDLGQEQISTQMEESEERYRRLFSEIQEGFALHEILLDPDGEPYDYRFLAVNPAFERMTALKSEDVLGCTVLEVLPDTEAYWIETYGKVALTGEPISFENYTKGLDKHFEVIAFSPQKNQFATLFVDITTRVQNKEKIQRQVNQLSALREIDIAITNSLELKITLLIILDYIKTQLSVDASSVLLLDQQSTQLTYAQGRGFRTDGIVRSIAKFGQGHAGKAALSKQIVQGNLLEEMDDFSRKELLAGEDFVTYFGVPLVAKGTVIGVLDIFNRTPLEPDQEWFDFLEALAGQTAIAVENARLFDELSQLNISLALAYDSTLEGWSKALELSDDETKGHSQRVTEMTMRLAAEVGIPASEWIHIRRGALLHDIGKIGTPDAILLKPGPLDEEEWAVMKLHPKYAYDLIYPIEFLRPALDIPYCHHERWDGSGYPRGLEGQQIPLAARLFAVVDVWDALLSDRPYREAWPEGKVIEYLKEGAGRDFDPSVITVFLDMIQKEK